MVWRDAGFVFFLLVAGFELRTGPGSRYFHYNWERDFLLLCGYDAGFATRTERDTVFHFPCDFIN